MFWRPVSVWDLFDRTTGRAYCFICPGIQLWVKSHSGLKNPTWLMGFQPTASDLHSTVKTTTHPPWLVVAWSGVTIPDFSSTMDYFLCRGPKRDRKVAVQEGQSLVTSSFTLMGVKKRADRYVAWVVSHGESGLSFFKSCTTLLFTIREVSFAAHISLPG